MINQQSKRKKAIILLKNLGLTTIVIGLVAVLIFLIQGWTVDREGKPVQSGLVQFATAPTGATVKINGAELNEKTNAKALLSPGEYKFQLSREGYEDWNRTAKVEAGGILWLNYARLVPKQKKLDSFLELQNLKTAKFSEKQKRGIAISEAADGLAKFWLVELGDTPKISEISVSETVFVGLNSAQIPEVSPLHSIAGQLSIDSLSENADKMILRRETGEKTEWIFVDINNTSNSVNLTEKFGLNFSQVVARDKSFSRFYVLANHELRELNVNDLVVSANLVDNIVQISAYNENIFAVTQQKQDQFAVGIYEKGRKIAWIAQQLTVQPQVEIGRYYGENYVHVASGETLTIYKGKEWFGANQPKKYRSKVLGFTANSLSLNKEMRLVKLSDGAQSAVFDLETDEFSAVKVGNLRWLDNFILYNFDNGKIAMRDFNGLNKYELMNVSADFSTTLSADEKFIYTWTQEPSGIFKLIRLKMVL